MNREGQEQLGAEAQMASSGPLRVLYIHGCGTFGGASKSLLTMIESFPTATVRPFVICPSGSAADFFEQAGVPVLKVRGLAQFDNSMEGYYRGRRWLVLLREVVRVWNTVTALRQARKWGGFDLIHVNEILLLFPAFLARQIFRAPVVVHARVVQTSKARLRARMIGWFLRRFSSAVVAIDDNVRASLPGGVEAVTIHNGFKPSHSRGYLNPLGNRLRPRSEGWLRVAAVGNLLAIKGVYEFIEAARLAKQRGLEVEFILVGDNVRRTAGFYGRLTTMLGFTRDVRSDVSRFTAHYGLEDRLHHVGFTPDVQRIYENVDVLCFPSRLEGVGRPVFEAAYSRRPSIVAVSHPRPDTFINGETGISVEPGDPVALVEAIQHFHDNRAEVARMGSAAYELACRTFDCAVNARKMLSLYQALLRQPDTATLKEASAVHAGNGD